jgi:protein-disulfide isomerase
MTTGKENSVLQVDDIERLSRFHAGELSEAEAAQVKAALEQNPELARALARLKRLDALAAEVAREERSAAAKKPFTLSEAARPSRTGPPIRRLIPLALAASLAAALTWTLTESGTPRQARGERGANASAQPTPTQVQLFEGAVVERSGDGYLLRSGTALFEGENLSVRCAEETLRIDGRALVSMEPEAAVSHVTRSAGPNSQGEDMQKLKAQWTKSPPSTAGVAVMLAVLSGTATTAEGAIPAGSLWLGQTKPSRVASPAPQPGPTTPAAAPAPEREPLMRRTMKLMLAEGEIPFGQLSETLNDLGPAVAKCFEKGRAATPKLQGDVTLVVTIVPAASGGRAEDVQVEGYTLQNPFVVSCLAQAAMALKYPAPTTPKAKIIVPLALQARGEVGSEGVEVRVASVGEEKTPVIHMPDRESRVEPRTTDAAVLGGATAPVTMVGFIDYECTFCTKVWPVLEQLVDKYGSKVRFVFLQNPLTIHPTERRAAEAAVAAQLQGRFREYSTLLMAEQTMHDDAGLDALARRAGLDLQRFRQVMTDGTAAKLVDAHMAEAKRLGVKGMPSFFINGKEVVGARPLASYVSTIDAELNAPRP